MLNDFPSVYRGERKSFGRLQEHLSVKELLAGRISTLHRAELLQQTALSLHPLNDPGDHLITSARIAVAEQSSHVGISLNDHFA